MSVIYVVKTGDNLSVIAKKFGKKSWQEIYYAPENEEFRRKRPNPNLIFTGDRLVIPSKSDPVDPIKPPAPPPARGRTSFTSPPSGRSSRCP